MVLTLTGGEDLQSLIARNDHLAVLRHVRSHRLRRPLLVINQGKALLGEDIRAMSAPSPVASALGIGMSDAEVLAVLEQMCEAAMDLGDTDLAESCLVQIRRRVDGQSASSTDGGDGDSSKPSARLGRLLGMYEESRGDLDAAAIVYDNLLRSNPANSFALKRKYCLLRAQVGKEVEAMEALNDYVERNQGDAGAWLEMSKLCMEVGDYRGAAYCHEELVLANPLDATLHCSLGEIYATCGGVANLRLARRHLAQSLDLSGPGDNLRALYGLVAAASAFVDETASGRKRKGTEEEDVEVAKELVRYGAENLVRTYKGSRLSSVVSAVMEAQLADL